MKQLYFTLIFSCITIFSFTQEPWQETATAPEGGGITDLIYLESTDDLFAVTASNNWPNGDNGGIRRSSDEGDTWTNLFDAYAARTIKEGPDGNLYASVWPYPQDEGLYRSSNNGDSWDMLTSVPSGNNIFSVAIKEVQPNNIIFAGTREGVMRSLDNGTNWSYANNGIPSDSWVRSMEIGPNGTIAAGTTNGLFVSFDNGDNWSMVTGDYENETIVSLMFEQVSTKDEDVNLYAGTASGLLIMTTYALAYTAALLVHNYQGQFELTKLRHIVLTAAIVSTVYMITMYSSIGGNFMFSNLGVNNWQQHINGLPANFVVSMFAATIATSASIRVFLGLFMAVNGGARIYKSVIDTQTGNFENTLPKNAVELMQNFPNPFKNSTRIGFNLENSGHTILELFDISGKKIRTLTNEYLSRGLHHINLTDTGLEEGMYYYTLQSGDAVITKKLIVQ